MYRRGDFPAYRQRRLACFAACRGAVHHQHCVACLVPQDGSQRDAVSGRVGIAQHINGIAARPIGGHVLLQYCLRFRGQLGELSTGSCKGVDRQYTGAPAIGEDRQPVVSDRLAGAEDFGGIEKLREAVDQQDARPGKGRLIDIIGADHGAGVRQRRPGCELALSGLDRDDGLGERRRPCRHHEFGCLGYALDVEKNGMGVRVGCKKIDKVAEVSVGHVSGRDDGGKPDAAGLRPIEHGGNQRAALGYEAQMAGLCRGACEGGVDLGMGRHDAEAIGADDP